MESAVAVKSKMPNNAAMRWRYKKRVDNNISSRGGVEAIASKERVSSGSWQRAYGRLMCQCCGCVHVCRTLRLHDFLPPLARDSSFDNFVVTSSALTKDLHFLRELSSTLRRQKVDDRLREPAPNADDAGEKETMRWRRRRSSTGSLAGTTTVSMASLALSEKVRGPLVQLTLKRTRHKKAIYQQCGHMLDLLVLKQRLPLLPVHVCNEVTKYNGLINIAYLTSTTHIFIVILQYG